MIVVSYNIIYLYSHNTADSGTCDRAIDPTNQNQYIVWGIGSLGETAFQHHTRASSEYIRTLYMFIHVNRKIVIAKILSDSMGSAKTKHIDNTRNFINATLIDTNW